LRRWDELAEPFKRLVFRDGVEKTAEKINADRSTVYRILNGETRRPCKAIRAGVERLVERDDKPAE